MRCHSHASSRHSSEAIEIVRRPPSSKYWYMRNSLRENVPPSSNSTDVPLAGPQYFDSVTMPSVKLVTEPTEARLLVVSVPSNPRSRLSTVSTVTASHASQYQPFTLETSPPPTSSGAVWKEKRSEAPVPPEPPSAFTATNCAQ